MGEYLGSGTDRTKKILKSLCNEIDLADLDVDEALRKFQSHIRIQVRNIEKKFEKKSNKKFEKISKKFVESVSKNFSKTSKINFRARPSELSG